MSEIKLTAQQQAACENRGGALLVSAAAGSGKTKVLVERLMRRVCDRDNPCNIDDFLIITFTNAAAAELRGRIASELSERLALNPGNRHLARQMTRIWLAQISTVHAFCSTLLRQYAPVLDQPSDFRVAEEADARVLQQEVLDRLLSSFYEMTAQEPDLAAMIDELGFGRDDRRLQQLILPLYSVLRCRIDPEKWLEECETLFSGEPVSSAEKTIWGEYLLAYLRKETDYAAEDLRRAIRLCAEDDALNEKYVPLLQENLETVRRLHDSRSWDEAMENRVLSFGTIPAVRSCSHPNEKEQAAFLRKNALENLRSAQSFLYAESKNVLLDLEKSYGAQRGLIRLLREFDKAYSQEKRRRKIFDFSDLEHEALRLLCRKDSAQPTQAAKEISARYAEIMVDEYQDSNEIQERIYQAVSDGGRNLFMVGDVKQSIYRFRMAEPGIFSEKYNRYPGWEQARDGQPRKVLLSSNFRSRKEILDAANDVFSLVMNRDSLELDYGDDEKLLPGAVYPETPQPKVELHCIDMDIEKEENESDAKRSEEEANFVARRIRKLLDDGTPVTENGALRPAQPGDIVILMRSPGNSVQFYQNALSAVGITSISDRGENLLDSTEAEVLFAILQMLDNPHRDIPLITAMASPVFDFSPEELAIVRTEDRKSDFYACLCSVQAPSEKLCAFLAWLSDMRRKSRQMGAGEILDEIFATTGLEDVFASMPDGNVRTENLTAFRALAQSYEATGSRNLMQFCRYLENLRESGASVLPPEAAASRNAVTIMSVHRSKGLEFPIVVLADLSHQMNLQDNTVDVLSDEELFFGTNIIDRDLRVSYPGIARLAIARKKTMQTVAEELRVLYVAMTRAKEMLIMTWCGAHLQSTLQKFNHALSLPLSGRTAASARRLGDWIMMAALLRTEAGALFEITGPNAFSFVHDDPWLIRRYSAKALREERGTENGRMADIVCPSSIREDITDLLEYAYPYASAANIPSKLTATEIKGRIPDLEAAENAQTAFSRSSMKWRRPTFDTAAPLTGREKGNATHLFMQYVRYEQCTGEDTLRQELARLTQEQFLSQRQAQAVDLAGVLKLFCSDFGKRILRAEKLRREFKFSVLEDAGTYFPDAENEKIMLQGVVDCFWQEKDGLVIVDFKTDVIHADLAQKAERYRPQVKAYAGALEKIFGCPVKQTYLYFFSAEQAVEI